MCEELTEKSNGDRESAADPYQMSAASLAYLGDAVYEIQVRTALVTAGVTRPSVASLQYVTAIAQCRFYDKIRDLLTEKENDVWHRGRNCVHNMPPKSCTMAEYRRATGLEAVFGYLWLTGNKERITELCRIGFAGTELSAEADISGTEQTSSGGT